jgi:uroporphyrinogen decarboxylase
VDGCPLVPGFKGEIIEEDEKSITFFNGHHQKMKAIKDSFSMPMYLDWPVKDRTSWQEVKKRLDPHTPERWPKDWDAYVEKMNSMEDPVVLEVGGFYGYLREWIGSERVLYMFYDDPNLIEDMMEQMLYLEMKVIERVIKDIKVDEADFWEDMAYKAGPFISPNMIRKFIVPRYKQITDLLRSNGVDIIFVDCDGKLDELIPIWLESGINYIWPLEQSAGNDAVAFRKKYGNDLIMGGAIDKRELLKGKEAIYEEVMSKVPYLLEKGGYFPSVDHLVPPGVSFENYCYYINLLREIAGLEKISF